MPCGGIYPIRDANPNWKCFFCHQKGCDHFCDEWDCGLHETCVIPFLHTEEGELVLDHKHHIQIGSLVLQEEDGEFMDPNETLRQARETCKKLAVLREDESGAGLEDTIVELVDAFENLDNWLRLGGFPPTDWKPHG